MKAIVCTNISQSARTVIFPICVIITAIISPPVGGVMCINAADGEYNYMHLSWLHS